MSASRRIHPGISRSTPATRVLTCDSRTHRRFSSTFTVVLNHAGSWAQSDELHDP
ncbi:hypothetical protein HMPREF0321_1785 [Dermacoccus sp. Ellin185]|nr:hypothetical protein HMPREF0321_1785 [Dermacoccus sp. Ellin185]